MRLVIPVLLVLAGCTPRVYHREVQRPVADHGDAFRCSLRQVEAMGYRVHDPDPDAGFTAVRPRPQPEGARYPVSDYLAVDLLEEGGTPVLRVGAVTLAGGGGGVHPHFRDPLPRTEADRDAVLQACAGAPAPSS
jgi:hypothetical protein